MRWKLQLEKKKGGKVEKAESVLLLIHFLRLMIIYFLLHNVLSFKSKTKSINDQNDVKK